MQCATKTAGNQTSSRFSLFTHSLQSVLGELPSILDFYKPQLKITCVLQMCVASPLNIPLKISRTLYRMKFRSLPLRSPHPFYHKTSGKMHSHLFNSLWVHLRYQYGFALQNIWEDGCFSPLAPLPESKDKNLLGYDIIIFI